MCGLRSITLGTTNIEQTKHFIVDILGLNYEELLENSIRFGDADISQEQDFNLYKFQVSN